MLTNKRLKDFTIRATDGQLGTVEDLYFDDETWAIRYLVVDTGKWLSERRVLISPMAAVHTDWDAMQLDVALTMDQVEQSPGIDARLPVSRQDEAEYLAYYGYPYHWGGSYEWAPSFHPAGLAGSTNGSAQATVERAWRESEDSHLRSAEAITGYRIAAADDEIGHVDGFVLDDEAWTIRYLEVATRNWLPGKKVLVSPAWIDLVSWEHSAVYTALTCAAIKAAPEYIESRPIGRDYESRLHTHYGRPPYWLHRAERKPADSPIGV